MTEPTRYVLVLVPMPSELPPIARLKAALKLLRRGFHLRCVHVTQHDAQDTPAEQPDPHHQPDAEAVTEQLRGQSDAERTEIIPTQASTSPATPQNAVVE